VEEEKGRLQVFGPLVGDVPWLSGDVGRVDEKGRVWVEGRVDDMILSGGEMVDPQEIEAVLTSHPGISEAAVIARVDGKWGERPVAFLVATDGTPPSEDELKSWCRTQLMGFKVPDAWHWCENLPRTDLGKLSRAALRKIESQLGQPVDKLLR
jgi:acyl-coenzyme A synthetase/AMP-(fatty) acid ligase